MLAFVFIYIYHVMLLFSYDFIFNMNLEEGYSMGMKNYEPLLPCMYGALATV